MNVEKESIKIVGKVSIIVPVYNVQEHIRRCILSILEQTYGNIEVILINDGSTDDSGYICDEYAEKDERVKVIHKENSGSSDARNMGMDIATGDYFMFVDSDDYVDSKIIEHLMSIMGGADISSCGHKLVKGESVDIREYNEHDYSKIDLSRIDALSRLMYRKGLTNSPWAKLFKKNLFDGIRFPSGKVHQDLGTIYKVVARADRVVVSDAPLYYYVQREGSIMNSPFSLKRMAGLEFTHEQLGFMQENFPSLVRAAENRLFTEAVGLYLKIKGSTNSNEFTDEQNSCLNVIRKYRGSVLLDSDSRTKPRISAGISFFGETLFTVVGLAIKKKVEKKL
jgi:glycosyltransferase involved in cell wall biosynthesis